MIFLIAISASFVFAQNTSMSFCCEKTTYGAWCQNNIEEKCDADYRKTPTSCQATSFCKLGCCYDIEEGLCMENSPQKTCEVNGGVWSDNENCNIPQCQLGCCVLGDQAAFVSLVRCKRLSAFYGLKTDFRKNIESENACIAIAQAQDKGACVYESDFQTHCRFTTRQGCTEKGNATVTFYKDYLCTSEKLGTVCGPTDKTTCVEGKDEVYFIDSCGNAANIYDASRINDKTYWEKIIPKEESCNAKSGNANSPVCGNCDYFLGGYCKQYDSSVDKTKPRYGEYICKDLNCKTTMSGESRKHGESWCMYDDENSAGEGKDKVGSRYWRHMCVFGEEIVEPCADLRAEVCLEAEVETNKGVFIEAGCKANMWQDCLMQDNEGDCLDENRRDCRWVKTKIASGNATNGTCLPNVPPGLKFWEEGEAQGVCKQGTNICVVKFERDLFGHSKCVRNCECLDKSWIEQQNQMCVSMGDCGSYVNYVDVKTEEG